MGFLHALGDRDPPGAELGLPDDAAGRGRAGRRALDGDDGPELAEDRAGRRAASTARRDRREPRALPAAGPADPVQSRGPADTALGDLRRWQEPDHDLRRRHLRRRLEPRRAARRAAARQPSPHGLGQPAVGESARPAARRRPPPDRLARPRGTIAAMVGSRARAAKREYTIDDLDELWTGEKRYEVTDGELVELTPPGFGHGRIEMRLGRLLSEHVERNDLGEVVIGEAFFRLEASGRTGRAADVAFVRKERIPPDLDELRAFPGAPD